MRRARAPRAGAAWVPPAGDGPGTRGVPGLTAARLLPLALIVAAAPAVAQDFAAPEPAGPAASACAFLERGLPGAATGASLDACFTRWFALPELETRAVAAAAGFRSARLAAGLSQTGEPELGWGAAGLAGGVAGPAHGAGLRAVARRDRAIEPGSAAARSLEARAGVELGGGAWLEAAAGLRLWVSAPQLWLAGTAPPLERPLEIGALLERDGLGAWLVRTAGAAAGPPDHAAGLALRSGPLAVWGAVRDRPLRASVGVVAAARGIRVAAEVEGHPDLGETARVSLGLCRRGATGAGEAPP